MDEIQTLKKTFERNDRWSGWSGQAIVAGLALDIVVLLLFASDKSWIETAGGIFATLVIAAGVWFEIHFGHKASAASVRLQQISDEKIAEAEARAAEATQKAREAEERTERLRAIMELQQKPRDIGISDEMFLKALEGKPTASVELMYDPNVPDAYRLAIQIGILLGAARWQVDRNVKPIPTPLGFRTHGITLLGKTGPDSNSPGAIDALSDAIHKSKAEIGTNSGRDNSLPEGVIRLIIGPKTPTWL